MIAIVNLYCILKNNDKYLWMINGEKAIISRYRLSQFKIDYREFVKNFYVRMWVAIILFSILELILYYVCIICITSKLMNAKIKTKRVLISILIFPFFSILLFFYPQKTYVFLIAIYQILEIIIAYICIEKIRFLSLFSVYFSLFLTNIIIISIIDSLFSLDIYLEELIELFVNIFTSLLSLFICYSKFCTNLKLLIRWTSKKIKILSLIFLLSCALLRKHWFNRKL